MTVDKTADLGPVEPDEIVMRLIPFSKYIRENGTLKGPLFQDKRYPAELSVIRTNTLTTDQVWQIADKYMPKKVHGAASILVKDAEVNPLLKLHKSEITQILNLAENIQDINEITIKVEASPDPHPYHANITYKPFHKAIANHIANHLARNSKLIRRD